MLKFLNDAVEKGADHTCSRPGQCSTPGLNHNEVIKLRKQTDTSEFSECRKHSHEAIVCLQMRWLMDLIIKSLLWNQIATVQSVTAP